ncbi:FtsW/RodA/SpoVE family cell cycle protein [Actinoallomurus acanthiterrae]
MSADLEVHLPDRPRRGAQLAMLAFAMTVALAAFAQVGLARDGQLPAGMFGYGGGLAVLVGIAYVIVARFAPYADPVLLPFAVFLNGLGLAMIYRLDLQHSKNCVAAKAAGQQCYPINASAANQLMWTAISVVFFAVVLLVLRDLRVLQRYRYTIGAVGLFFLILPGLLPSSISGAGGAKVWLRLGGFSIQPGEFAKIALIVFFAGYLVSKRDAMSLVGRRIGPLALPRGRDLGPILVIWLMSVAVLVLEKDLGQGVLFFGLFIAMLYIATERVSWVLIGLGLFSAGAFAATQLPFLGHVNQRFTVWSNPKAYFDGGCAIGGKVVNQQTQASLIHATSDTADFVSKCIALGGHYADSGQPMRAMFSLAQGGVLGTGLGQGQPYLTPVSYADYIFTSFGEELGLAGLMVILLVFALIVERGMKAALLIRDPFLKLFTGGISFIFALQVFLIVASVTGLIPLTAGVTTPFLAQGGSALLSNWIFIAILIRISDAARRPAPQPIQDEGMTQIVRAT